MEGVDRGGLAATAAKGGRHARAHTAGIQGLVGRTVRKVGHFGQGCLLLEMKTEPALSFPCSDSREEPFHPHHQSKNKKVHLYDENNFQ